MKKWLSINLIFTLFFILSGCAMDQEKATALVSAINAANMNTASQYNNTYELKNAQQVSQLQTMQRTAQLQQLQDTEKLQAALCPQAFEQERISATQEGRPVSIGKMIQIGCIKTPSPTNNPAFTYQDLANQYDKYGDTIANTGRDMRRNYCSSMGKTMAECALINP